MLDVEHDTKRMSKDGESSSPGLESTLVPNEEALAADPKVFNENKGKSLPLEKEVVSLVGRKDDEILAVVYPSGKLEVRTILNELQQEGMNPFRWCNVAISLGCFAAFLLFTVNIVHDYQLRKALPPLVFESERVSTQVFPSFVACLHDDGLELQDVWITSKFGKEGYFTPEILIWHATDHHPVCPDGQRVLQHCVMFNETVPAFIHNDMALCGVEQNTLTIYADVQSRAVSGDVLQVGLYGSFFENKGNNAERVVADYCSNFIFACGDNDDDVLSDGECYRVAQTAFSVPAGFVNFDVLRRREIENPACGNSDVTWKRTSNLGSINANYSLLQEDSLDATDVAGLVLSLNLIVNRGSYPQTHWSAPLGASAGWFGFLTEGWGIISVLNFLQAQYLNWRFRR